MPWMSEFADPAALRERALRSMAMPIGLANPLWLTFGAAATTGAAWWLMTRWTRPFHAEAMFSAFAPPVEAAPEPVAGPPEEPIRPVDERTPETAPVLLDVADAVAPACVEAAEAPLEAVLAAAHEVIEAESVIAAEVLKEAEAADDLTRLVGVGPRTAAALMERGVTRFAQLAAWSEAEMAAFDAQLNLKGRSVRDRWRDQAQRLAEHAAG